MAGSFVPTDLRNLPDPQGLFDLIEVVGTGTYGEVYKGRHKNTGQLTGIKIMDLIDDEEEEIVVEVDVLKQHSRHENITSFYGIYGVKTPPNEDDKLWLCMEYCGGGTITDLCKKLLPKKLPEIVFAFVLRETLQALEYLHQNGVVHRDIKGQNILITDNGEIRLIDFGVSAQNKKGQSKRNTFIGTPYWMAPEVIATDTQDDAWYDTRSDIWSLGITAIEIADTEPPLSDLHPMRALYLIPRNKPPQLPDKKKWSKEMNNFVVLCLEKDFEKRATATKLLEHPVIKRVVTAQSRASTAELIDRHRSKASFRTPMDDENDIDGTLGPDNETRSLGSEVSNAGLSMSMPSTPAPGKQRFDPATGQPLFADLPISEDASGDVDTLTREGKKAPASQPAAPKEEEDDTQYGFGAQSPPQAAAPPVVHSPHAAPSLADASQSGSAMFGLAGSTGDSKEGAIHRKSVHRTTSATSHTKMDSMVDTRMTNLGVPTKQDSVGAGPATTVPANIAQPSVNLPGFGNFGGPAGQGDSALPNVPKQGLTKMPEIRRFKRSFNSEILCSTFWHSSLVVGTKNGLICLERNEDAKQRPLVSRRRFTRIDVLEDIQVMVSISGKKGALRAYSLHYFAQVMVNKSKAHMYEAFQDINAIQGCVDYQIARYEKMCFLCAAHANTVSVYLWAPAPYSKFMVFKDFTVPHKPQKVHLSVGDDESMRLVFAASGGFYTIDVQSGSVLNLYVPRPQPKGGITPLSVLRLPVDINGETNLMLLYDGTAVMVDSMGDTVKDFQLPWEVLPTSVMLASSNSLLGWGKNSIEIRSTENGSLEGTFKHRRASRLRYLCSHRNKVFFASVKSSSSCQIYFMVF